MCMNKIGIFCSASDNIDKMYFDAAGQIGKWMGTTGKTLVYGGANLGLMECIAKAVKANGGHVIGVVPAKLEENGKVRSLPDRQRPERPHCRRIRHPVSTSGRSRYIGRNIPRHGRCIHRLSS